VFEAVDDGADFIIKDLNPAVEQLEQVDKAAVVGRRVTDIFPGIEKMGLFATLQRVWRSGQPEQCPTVYYQDAQRQGWRRNYVYRIPSGEVVAVYSDETPQKSYEAQLKKREAQLKEQTRHLAEVNTALKVLLSQRDRDRADIEAKVVANVRALVMPYLNALSQTRMSERQRALMQTATINLENIVSPFVRKTQSMADTLSPAEVRVVDLVRQGYSNKEIAGQLGVSVNTILTHRFKIRKKLGLKGRKVNLKSYLRSIENSDATSLFGS